MNREIYRYKFSDTVPMDSVDESLYLAVLAIECLYGRSRILMDTAYYVDEKKRACVIDARDEIGRSIARILTGFLTREFGEKSFTVEHVYGPPKPQVDLNRNADEEETEAEA